MVDELSGRMSRMKRKYLSVVEASHDEKVAFVTDNPEDGLRAYRATNDPALGGVVVSVLGSMRGFNHEVRDISDSLGLTYSHTLPPPSDMPDSEPENASSGGNGPTRRESIPVINQLPGEALVPTILGVSKAEDHYGPRRSRRR